LNTDNLEYDCNGDVCNLRGTNFAMHAADGRGVVPVLPDLLSFLVINLHPPDVGPWIANNASKIQEYGQPTPRFP